MLSSLIVAFIDVVLPEKMSESIETDVICGASRSIMLRTSKVVEDVSFVVVYESLIAIVM